MGESVIEHSPEFVELRVDFPFARVPGRAIPRGENTRYRMSASQGVV